MDYSIIFILQEHTLGRSCLLEARFNQSFPFNSLSLRFFLENWRLIQDGKERKEAVPQVAEDLIIEKRLLIIRYGSDPSVKTRSIPPCMLSPDLDYPPPFPQFLAHTHSFQLKLSIYPLDDLLP